jgi:excisionase family DNA binding protein
MITIDNENYLTLKESTRFLDISLMTLHRWVKSGKLKTYKISERKILIKENDLKWLVK